MTGANSEYLHVLVRCNCSCLWAYKCTWGIFVLYTNCFGAEGGLVLLPLPLHSGQAEQAARKSLAFLHGESRYKQYVCPRLFSGNPAAGCRTLGRGLHTQHRYFEGAACRMPTSSCSVIHRYTGLCLGCVRLLRLSSKPCPQPHPSAEGS